MKMSKSRITLYPDNYNDSEQERIMNENLEVETAREIKKNLSFVERHHLILSHEGATTEYIQTTVGKLSEKTATKYFRRKRHKHLKALFDSEDQEVEAVMVKAQIDVIEQFPWLINDYK